MNQETQHIEDAKHVNILTEMLQEVIRIRIRQASLFSLQRDMGNAKTKLLIGDGAKLRQDLASSVQAHRRI